MKRKEELLLEQEQKIGEVSALNKLIQQGEKAWDTISKKVKATEVVAGVSGAVSFLSGYMLASTNDFHTQVVNDGFEILQTPEGLVMGAICAGGMLIAGASIALNNYFQNKLDYVEDKIDARTGLLEEKQVELGAVNEELAQIEHGEAFVANWLKQTKDFEEPSAEITPEE